MISRTQRLNNLSEIASLINMRTCQNTMGFALEIGGQ
jgi:hypothetical protein